MAQCCLKKLVQFQIQWIGNFLHYSHQDVDLDGNVYLYLCWLRKYYRMVISLREVAGISLSLYVVMWVGCGSKSMPLLKVRNNIGPSVKRHIWKSRLFLDYGLSFVVVSSWFYSIYFVEFFWQTEFFCCAF